jgi:branched-chain amino acid transport system substrate-binding protein
VTGAIGSQGLATYVTGMQPYAPTKGPAWSAFNTSLLASTAVPKPAQWASDPYSMTYYDAVNLMALSMLAAKSTQPSTFAKQIVGLTTASPGAITVYSFAEGKKALAAGKKIRYVGAGGEIAFDQWRNSSGAFEAAVTQGTQTKIVGTVTAAQIAKLKGHA